MAPDEPSGTRPAPVVIRIKLRYPDVATMVQRFAPNIGKSGLFLPTRTMHPVGTEVKFELRLSTDQPVLVGLGRVQEARPPDPNNPRVAFGLAVELMRVTREGRDVILKMLERRRQLGLSEVAIPVPSDVETARRVDVETNPRIMLPSPTATPSSKVEPTPLSPTLTSPRRTTSPVTVQKVYVAPAPLAAEAPRRRRVPLGELIESATSAATSVLDEDDAVDVGKALVRARALAGADLDKELEVLLDSTAAPIAIDIEAASAELARQLGGAAVRRGDRSARSAKWAPPPAVTDAIAEATAAIVDDAAQPAIAEALDAVAAQLAAPVEDAPPEAVELPPRRTVLPPADDEEDPDAELRIDARSHEETLDPPPRTLIHDDLDPAEFDAAPSTEVPPEEPEHEVGADQIDDEIHQLQEADFEEVEETYAGDAPQPPPSYPAERPNALEARLDEELAQAEADGEADDMGISPTVDGEPDDDSDDFDERPSSEYLPTADGEPPVAAYEAPLQLDGGEEVDDFEILAEADAEADAGADADAYADASEEPLPPPPPYDDDEPITNRPSVSDFALRLDLPDDSEVLRLPRRFRAQTAETDARVRSAGAALAAFDDDDDEPSLDESPARRRGPRPLYDDPSASYTVPAEVADLVDPRLDTRLAQFDESDVIALPPALRRTPPPPAEADLDLESALEALDVDLDDLSFPHATEPRRHTPRPRAERTPPPRATTEDGVLIDFDDDE